MLKLFRQLDAGPNPEIEMRSRLHHVGFTHTPAIVAAFRWQSHDARRPSAWIGILQEFVENDGEAWTHAVRAAAAYLGRALRHADAPPDGRSLLPDARAGRARDPLDALVGPYLRTIERLGQRTADLHRALATPTADPAFAPDRFTPFSRRSAYQRMRRCAVTVLDLLRARAPALDEDVRPAAQLLVERGEDVLSVFRPLLDRPLSAPRIRCHGNFHLGQVLHAGADLVVIDFDGEPGRPLYERRPKRSPLHDVATMVRSFHYAAHAAAQARQRQSPRAAAQTEGWMRAWQRRVGSVFVAAYVKSLAGAALLPDDEADARLLLHASLVERALYELGFELNRGSRWVRVALEDLPLLLPPAAGRA